MIFIHKLPTVEPEMRNALRSHIFRKRQRLKQELEQDAIEKRLRREKEVRQLQDAMTLDQIKEQLSSLEKRLESLKDEKHDLFVQLKQVLNEDDARRKQEHQSNEKKQKSCSDKTEPVGPTPVTVTGPASIDVMKSVSYVNTKATTDESIFAPKKPVTRLVYSRPPPPFSGAGHLNNFNSGLPIVNQPSKPISSLQNYLNPGVISTRQYPPDKHSSSSVPSQMVSPSMAASFEFVLTEPMSYDHANLPSHLLPRPLIEDTLMNSTTNYHDTRVYPGKRTVSVTNPGDSQLNNRKRASNIVYSSSTHYPLNGVPPGQNQPTSLSKYCSTSQSVYGSSNQVPSYYTSKIKSNFHLPRQVPNNFNMDLGSIMNQSKPGVIMPGLNSLYSAHPTLIHQNPIHYPTIENNYRHNSSPYTPLSQHYGNTSRHSNSHFSLSELDGHNPSSNISNYHRKPPKKISRQDKI